MRSLMWKGKKTIPFQPHKAWNSDLMAAQSSCLTCQRSKSILNYVFLLSPWDDAQLQ